MGELVLKPRRKPLGDLPRARLGVRPGAVGLVLDLTEEQLLEAKSIGAPASDFLTRVASTRTTSWALRFEGLLPEAVRQSSLVARFIPIGHTPRDGHVGGSELLDKSLTQLMPAGAFIAIPKVIPETRDYLRVSTYDANVLPLDSLLVIDEDTHVTFGWLSSRAFWLWTQVVRSNFPTATTYTAYVNFPAPKLGRKDRNRLEVAVDTVLRSRSHLLNDTVDDLYSRLPEQLQWAHKELDVVVEELLGIPADSDDTEVIRLLLQRYQSLAA
jgi:hypothetical protein